MSFPRFHSNLAEPIPLKTFDEDNLQDNAQSANAFHPEIGRLNSELCRAVLPARMVPLSDLPEGLQHVEVEVIIEWTSQ